MEAFLFILAIFGIAIGLYILFTTKLGWGILALFVGVPVVAACAIALYPVHVVLNHVFSNWLLPTAKAFVELFYIGKPKFNSVRLFSGVVAFLTFGLGKSIFKMMTGNGDIVYKKKRESYIAEIMDDVNKNAKNDLKTNENTKSSANVNSESNSNSNSESKTNADSNTQLNPENTQSKNNSNSQLPSDANVKEDTGQNNNQQLSSEEILQNSYARFNEINRRIQSLNSDLLATGKPITYCRKLTKGIKETFGFQDCQRNALTKLLHGYHNYMLRDHKVVTLDEYLETKNAQNIASDAKWKLITEDYHAEHVEKVVTALKKSRPS